MTTTNTPLVDRVRQLAQERAALATDKMLYDAAFAEFSAKSAPLFASMRAKEAAVKASELSVRALAVAEYQTTENKNPAPGIQIKVGTDYIVDEAAALVWAREKKMCLIPESLDVAAIKKLATVQELPFVTAMPSPAATIAKDLDKALADVPAEQAVTV